MTDFDLSRLADIPDPLPQRSLTSATSGAPPVSPMVPSPTRSGVRRARIVALACAILFDAAWFAFVERRRDLGSLPVTTIALGLAIPLVAAGAALTATVRRGARGLGDSVVSVAALVCVAPLLFAAVTFLVAPVDSSDGEFVARATRCIAATAVLAAGPLALGLVALKRSFVAAAAWRTAALGVACGGVAAATMSVSCPDSGAVHVVIAHGVMMLVAGLAGALAANRVTRA